MFDYPLKRKSAHARLKNTDYQMREERRKPVLPGPWIYVGDFDTLTPPVVTWQSPPWIGAYDSVGTNYIAFRHGLDGQLDMIGEYDLTLGAVSGDVAFQLPNEYVQEAPPVSMFPIELDTDVWSIAIQTVDHTAGVTYGNVRLFWPIVADPVP